MRTEPTGDDIRPAVLGRLLTLGGRRMEATLGRVLRDHGLTPNAWWVLTELHGAGTGPALPLGRWAQRGGLPASSVTVAADLLVQRELVRCWRESGNRRVVLAEITDSGRRLVDRIRDELDAATADVHALFTVRERRILAELLTRVVPCDADAA
ncbi:MarR family winged helix-turn-helix transcriptional regulator [Couchioplanes azureus]|uniref:MarR family winged helix-turn-helix transcriptional regulator n=1 Tax=Couchioplanes caeruleus TaxID=56438 RepID=UPI001670B131|nr:MarR family transcriptional regulator [Couchioplanes caeruleus]